MTTLRPVSDSTTAVAQVNDNFKAVAAAGLYGYNAFNTTGLYWGYYGGQFNGVAVTDSAVLLTASATNYVVAHRTTGAVTAATGTTNWADTTTYLQLYTVVAGSSTITSFTDYRQAFGGATGGGGGGSGTVTSVALTMPGIFSVSGSPVTTSGTLAVTATDAGSDQLVFWDDSASALAYLTLGTNLSITGTTINAAGGGGGGTPAGSDKQVQYNNAGAFGAEGGFEYDQSTNTLTVANCTYTGLALTAASATGGAGLRLPHGAAPTSPTNGDVWTTTLGMYARINGATVGPFGAGGGGLTNFIESADTASPNNTVNDSRLLVVATSSNADMTLAPKGNGAIQRQRADGTATGGNKRGQYATDWQSLRDAAADVASGTGSVIGGGLRNKASGSSSTVGGGDTCYATGTGATVGGGSSNNTTGDYSTICGGGGNAASASYATVTGGQSNTANATHSRAGGQSSTTRGIKGADVFAGVGVGGAGKTQRGSYHLATSTADATPKKMSTDNTTAGTANQVILPDFSTYAFTGLVTARNTSGHFKCWSFQGMVNRDSGASSAALGGTITPTVLGNHASASAWDISVTADTTNGGVSVTVTGAAAVDIRWSGSMETVEVVS